MDARTEEDKLSCLNEFQSHIYIAQKERDLYKKVVKDSLKNYNSLINKNMSYHYLPILEKFITHLNFSQM